MKTVLVTGGAGYVGSTTVLHLRSLGHRVVVFDNLFTGHADLAALADRFVRGDLRDPEAIAAALGSEPVDGVIHCAARSLVPESMRDPLTYFGENVGGAVNLLRACVGAGNVPVVFSSSAAVYGEPQRTPIAEDDPKIPVNPYGFTKLAIEEALRAVENAHGLRSVSLRYFNAAGADPQARAGERHRVETHLVPNVVNSALKGDGRVFDLFGDDYPTRDGTCVRDYVHVLDVARAHTLALEHLWRGGATEVCNLGSGDGHTVREVFETIRDVLGVPVPHRVRPRRSGDPAVLLADNRRAARVLGWAPAHSTLREMVEDAIRWQKKDIANQT